MNGKKWRSRIKYTYATLLEEYGVPSIPILWSNRAEHFIKRYDSTHVLSTGSFMEDHCTFLFPYDLSSISRLFDTQERALGMFKPYTLTSPEHLMRHEFYHYLHFLTNGPTPDTERNEYLHRQRMPRREGVVNKYHQEEIDAEDFANAY